MDRQVKQRLVGASILVVLIVLVVPELLSGPTPAPRPLTLPDPNAAVTATAPVRHVTVDLATSKPAPAEPPPDPTATSSAAPPPSPLPPGAANPPPVAAADSGRAVSAPPDVQAVPPQSPPEAAPAGSVARAWSVQLGSFARQDNARKLMHQLQAQGFVVYMLSGGSGSVARYRVRVGPMQDRSAALQAVAKLKALGHEGSLVPPAS